MEAMASGLPCLASKIRGNSDLLENIPITLIESNTAKVWEKAITDFEEASYRTGVKAFLDDKGCYEDGKACERIVEELDKLMSE